MNNNILNSTYIGHIKKNLKGGIKIINDTKDKNIIKNRDFILNELTSIFTGGKELMYEDIPHYVNALEGKYIRNKICSGGNPTCKDACNLTKKSYQKLIKKSMDEFNTPELLNIIKGGSPYLYKKVYKSNFPVIKANKDIKTNNIKGGYEIDGSYSVYNATDKDYFNKITAMYCGEECPNSNDLDLSSKWGTTPDVERKVKNIDNNNKEWLINNWIYADNYYKINLIIILLEDSYSQRKNTNIVQVAVEFLLYQTCSGLVDKIKQIIGYNFFNIARTLREESDIKDIIANIKKSSQNNADDFCSTNRYDNTSFTKGGYNSRYKINNKKIHYTIIIHN